ncbi:nitroreductase family protein [Amycolatopsis tucumanensis]|uniref:Nitroreductase family protein n=1 Tax=Amycolatopsis tucumanensis TaxID=401106 RepID=A0ABP7IYW6_9PSEU|nr:nitroreductase family protein [Amycolatopsis tucumanensis]MCF6423433.1 nitroreductase family protein [Amycolatopsis tucumanensis]
MDADELLTTTRLVRRKLDLDRPVEQEVITEGLRVAMQAPIAGNQLDAIRWLVVRDPELKARVAGPVREVGEAAQRQYGHLVAPRSLASAKFLLGNIHRVPALAFACLAGRPDGADRSTRRSGASSSRWRARGLGSTITGYHLFGHEEEVARLLGISEGFTQVALLPVAYTTQKDFQPAARPPVEEITYLDRWGARVS